MRFDELPLDKQTLSALEAMGFEEATPVQADTIPLLLQGKDVKSAIGAARAKQSRKGMAKKKR